MGPGPGWVIDDVRRITGLHPLLDGPGVGVELRPTDAAGIDEDEVVRRIQEAIWSGGLSLGPPHLRPHARGLSLAFRAPEDRLEAAAELTEAALGADAFDPVSVAAAWPAPPGLADLLEGLWDLPHFFDEDGLTVGLGEGARTWPLDALPALAEARAQGRRVPFAFVTGTNGKTTTSRMLARIAQAAGRIAGFTSSDGVVVDGAFLTQGDWTGPGAARCLLRDSRLQLAVLETARGGLMRRGLALTGADAAAVTNISDDHLGEWGLMDLADMAWAKLTVARGLRAGGCLVVHGRNAALTEALPALLLARPDLRLRTFADGPAAPDLAAWATDGWLYLREDEGVVSILAEADLPASLGGAVRPMVENALCAALLARSLGLPLDAVRSGLRAFTPDLHTARGRLNRFQLPSGATAIVDFAHNPAGVSALAPLVARSRPGRLRVLVGQAGDRTDALIAAYAAAVAQLSPDQVVLKELPLHRRGRAEGEVRALLREALVASGLEPARIADEPDEVVASRILVEAAGPGDLCLLLVHEELDGVLAMLAEVGAGLG